MLAPYTHQVLLSPDVLFHDTLYRWLHKTQVDVLVHLRSPLLLSYLKYRANDPELLYKYYVAHDDFEG